jgi:redox-sensitive bicupin YhaK (pirin superfamily)
MRKTIYRADERGFANHGWLKTYHIFSFANYYDEERMGFGLLRVFNDDIVEPGRGFGTHPHDNMEIISIPLDGVMAHKDSRGNEYTIKEGDIQVMSAGSGLTHSEYNYSKDNSLNFLQLWVFPDIYNTVPDYQQKTFHFSQNELVLVVSPDEANQSLPIKQNAFFYLGRFSKGESLEYIRQSVSNGIFVFVVNGKILIEGESLHKRDAIGIENTDAIHIIFKENSFILLIEIPIKK